MTKKAIAYVSDIILGRTGEVISRASQRERIEEYARQNDIDIVAWFEDEVYAEDPAARPGFQKLLACSIPCEQVIVERVACLSRSWRSLRNLLESIQRGGKRVESATELWDCVSQQARWFYRERSARQREPVSPQVAAAKSPVRTPPKPAVLHFAGLKRSLSRA